MKSKNVNYKTVVIDGLKIFYREAGDANKPAILLLGGFPSTSITFNPLMNLLKNDYHLIAPDYPGFGISDAPLTTDYSYTFDNLADVIEKFVDTLGLKKFSLYAFDYGGPVGFRLAAKRPELIQSLIIQNANAYLEGIGPGFETAMPFLQNRTAETEKPIRFLFTLEGIMVFYLAGVENPSAINPDHYLSDLAYLSTPERQAIHLDLLQDYASNLGEFEKWQHYFVEAQPKTLLVWGKNDPFFPESSARAFLKDLPGAELHLYDTGHFALQEYGEEIAGNIRSFLNMHNINSLL